jgi:hypothetical protein
MAPEEALEIARRATPEPAGGVAPGEPNGLRAGEAVRVVHFPRAGFRVTRAQRGGAAGPARHRRRSRARPPRTASTRLLPAFFL